MPDLQYPNQGDHPKRRRMDRTLGKIEWVWQNGVPLVAIALAAIAVHGNSVAIKGNTTLIQRQAEGRSVAIDVLCGFGNGVAEAGRKALAGELRGQAQPGQRTGLPESAQRDYARTIALAVLQQAGLPASGLLQPNGQIDCTKLRVAARAPRKK